jgi:hypothetical protein
MFKKEKITNQKTLSIKNMTINKKGRKYKTLNYNLVPQRDKNKGNLDLVLQNKNNTISYNKSKYIKFFSSFCTNDHVLDKLKNIRKNNTELFSDKLIQTQPLFFKLRNAFMDKMSSSMNCSKNIKIKSIGFPNRNKLNIIHIPSVSKPTSINQSINKSINKSVNVSINKSINLPNKISIKNKIFMFKNPNKKIKSKNKSINYQSNKKNKESKSYFLSNRHKNLINIDSIFSQIYKQNNYKNSCKKIQNEKNIQKMPVIKKITFKKIKYPLLNNNFRNVKIIDENNEHLLEKIYKIQTVSNFNNKYNLKFKSNDSVKKERVKILFSLLKKYKNSEKEKNKLFLYYNKFNKSMK